MQAVTRLFVCLLGCVFALGCAFALGCGDDRSEPSTDQNALLPGQREHLPRGKANPPRLTQRIDRAGRPEIARVLGASLVAPEARQDIQERYNKAGLGNVEFRPSLESSLAMIDGIDGVCGNQLWAGRVQAQRYRSLANLLLNDQIYIHADRLGASVYLGLEAEAAGALAPPRTGEAGGRMPGADAIEPTLSALISGTLTGTDDGVRSDDRAHDPSTFPFLAAP